MHAGIQGGTDLTVADHGWTDPVARITVTVMPSDLPGKGGPFRGPFLLLRMSGDDTCLVLYLRWRG